MIYQLETLAGIEPAITLVKFFLIQTVFALADEGDAPTERKTGAILCWFTDCLCLMGGGEGGEKKKKQTLLFEFSFIFTAFRFDGHLVLKLLL